MRSIKVSLRTMTHVRKASLFHESKRKQPIHLEFIYPTELARPNPARPKRPQGIRAPRGAFNPAARTD